jgi:phage host-nuclease inhibitor protein Gam
LSYQDVQRCVQDATRDLRDTIHHVTAQLETLGNLSREVSVLHRELNDSRAALHRTVAELSYLRRSVSHESSSVQRMQSLAQRIEDQNVRMGRMEELLNGILTYLRPPEIETPPEESRE